MRASLRSQALADGVWLLTLPLPPGLTEAEQRQLVAAFESDLQRDPAFADVHVDITGPCRCCSHGARR